MAQHPGEQKRPSWGPGRGPNWRPSRRTLLIGGGAGLGLLVAWAVWPRTYLPNLTADAGETVFGAWLKIAPTGMSWSRCRRPRWGRACSLPFAQIIADELGADWRKVGVEAAPLNPLYANPLGAETLFEAALGGLPEGLRRTHATRTALVVTGGSSSIRNFEPMLREAGASARALLCKAAARRWGTDWQACDTAAGQVVHGTRKLGFGDLAADAAEETAPSPPVLRTGEANRLQGQRCRGSTCRRRSTAASISPRRAAAKHGVRGDPPGPGGRHAAGARRRGGGQPRARHALGGAHRSLGGGGWRTTGGRPSARSPRCVPNSRPPRCWSTTRRSKRRSPPRSTEAATASPAAATWRRSSAARAVVAAEYRVGLALHAALEPMTCTAALSDGRLALWLPTQAPGLARAAAARAAGMGEEHVTVHPMMAGGSFGAKLEHEVAAQAAVLATRIGRPVQLTWSRAEDARQDRFRPAAAARMTARLGTDGAITGWLAKIAAPATGRELAARLLAGDALVAAALALPGAGDPSAVAGAIPPYAIPNLAIDHHPAAIGVPTGNWRSAAHSYTAFFTESFIDELAHVANIEALSFRMARLGNEPRLAQCLKRIAELAAWQGGAPGTGQGIACHRFRGSYIAVLAEASLTAGRRVKVTRLVAAVDCGRMINPDLVAQQIEGGLIFGMAAALGCSTGITDNVADATSLADLNLPTLADSPDITVDLIRSGSDPGGVEELAVPPVAPAIANALQAATGVRFRRLPLLSDVE